MRHNEHMLRSWHSNVNVSYRRLEIMRFLLKESGGAEAERRLANTDACIKCAVGGCFFRVSQTLCQLQIVGRSSTPDTYLSSSNYRERHRLGLHKDCSSNMTIK